MGELRHKKTATQVLTRLMDLCDYFNTIKEGVCNDSNDDLMDRFGYSNRKALQRDLDRLKDMNYIKTSVSNKTPVSIKNGTASQFIRSYRKIYFHPSEEGLLGLPSESKPGDSIGRMIYDGLQEDIYKEDLEQRADKQYQDPNSEWILGPDHTLIRRP